MGWEMAIFYRLIFHRPVEVARPIKNGGLFFMDSPSGIGRSNIELSS